MCEDGIHTGGRVQGDFFHTVGMFPVGEGKSIIMCQGHDGTLSMDGMR